MPSSTIYVSSRASFPWIPSPFYLAWRRCHGAKPRMCVPVSASRNVRPRTAPWRFRQREARAGREPVRQPSARRCLPRSRSVPCELWIGMKWRRRRSGSRLNGNGNPLSGHSGPGHSGRPGMTADGSTSAETALAGDDALPGGTAGQSASRLGGIGMRSSFVRLRMSYSENRFPPRIKSGAGFFRDMRQARQKKNPRGGCRRAQERSSHFANYSIAVGVSSENSSPTRRRLERPRAGIERQ